MRDGDGGAPAPEKDLDQQPTSDGNGAFVPPAAPESEPPVAAAEPPVRMPSVGDVVHYHVAEGDDPATRHNNPKLLPAIITAVWGPAYVNLKLITDGPVNVWKSSVTRGDDPGAWNFRD